MWPFSRHISLADSGIFDGLTDWHSHILPGVDDGVRTLDESLDILRLYENLGVKSVWLTPHIMEDIPNTTADLRHRFDELRQTYTGPLTLHLASENMLDNLFEERLEANDFLPLGGSGDQLLVETSYFSPPMDLYGTMERIKSKGYYPVLAHPERYIYMDADDYKRLKKMGVKFQSNIPSLVNAYGIEVRKKLEWLLSEKSIDLWGTDTHHLSVFSDVIGQKTLKRSIVNII